MRSATLHLGEEIANSVTHGVALLAALAFGPFAIVNAVRHGDATDVVAASVFVGSLIAVYLSSTLYHAMPLGRVRRVMRVIDHSAIYLLIAGTYTPFTLGPLRGAWGWTLFGVVWGLAALGIVFKATMGMRWPALSTSVYIAMGWLIVVAWPVVTDRLPGSGLAWLAAGGVAYTSGVAFFAARRIRYAHTVWHLFVVVGSACHAVAVFGYHC